MKKILTGLIGGLMVLFLASGMAMGYSITYGDTFANWPGYEVDPRDQIGTPAVGDLTIYVSDVTGYLDKIEIEVANRQLWDTLYINTDYTAAYDEWDYYVITNDYWPYASTLYDVASTYTYSYATNPGSMDGRWGHPSGIETGLTEDTYGILASVTYDGVLLTYDFNFGTNYGIYIGSEDTASFVIGYSQWCANDPFLTPIPEPMTMLLLGFGILSLGLVRRKS